jgi:hypothetical protein
MNQGIMEYWKNGRMGFNWFEDNRFSQHSNVPSFHHSMKVVL